MYQAYVIQNPSGRFYIGLSEDVRVRLAQHNSGASKWTRGKGPWTLLWTSEALSLADARKLESFLKRQKGGNGFFRATGLKRHGAHNPAGRDRWFKSSPAPNKAFEADDFEGLPFLGP